MQFPELQEKNKKFIEVLSSISEEALDPLKMYEKFKGIKNLEENFNYFKAMYLDFEDNDYLHDTCPVEHIYLNDFDFSMEDDRQRLSDLISVEFNNTNTFDTVASCGCAEGGLRGNYLIGSNRVCPQCGNGVEKFLNKGSQSKLWVRPPEGVEVFVNLGVYNTLFTGLKVSKTAPICLPQYFMSAKYRRKCNTDKIGSKQVIDQLLDELKIAEVSLNSFYQNYDRLMEFLLNGPGTRTYTKLGVKAETYYKLYLKTRKVVFSKYMKAPNRLNTILEKGGASIYANKNQLAIARCFIDIADTKKSDEFYQLTERDIKRNNDVTGDALVELSEIQNRQVSKSHLFGKKQMARHHVSSGSVPFTGRAVISSEAGVSNPGELVIPWRMAVTILYYHITNALYRMNLPPKQTIKRINLTGYVIDKEISEIIEKSEKEQTSTIQSGRNPSNEYLSLRTFFLKVNRALEDESIHIPILACAPYNSKLHCIH